MSDSKRSINSARNARWIGKSSIIPISKRWLIEVEVDRYRYRRINVEAGKTATNGERENSQTVSGEIITAEVERN